MKQQTSRPEADVETDRATEKWKLPLIVRSPFQAVTLSHFRGLITTAWSYQNSTDGFIIKKI